jgi:DNA-binding HxlR family transcriptional regulator
MEKESGCPAQALLKKLSGKWKPEVFKLAVDKTVRFSTLLPEIKGTN